MNLLEYIKSCWNLRDALAEKDRILAARESQLRASKETCERIQGMYNGHLGQVSGLRFNNIELMNKISALEHCIRQLNRKIQMKDDEIKSLNKTDERISKLEVSVSKISEVSKDIDKSATKKKKTVPMKRIIKKEKPTT